ncbi:hypothetical protein B0H14DRAFT_3110645 [Mycena olivaceomarginata]|nr:hypothetical protein B0H14DRAFT_3110645 [Mycena olivaceomarginata]
MTASAEPARAIISTPLPPGPPGRLQRCANIVDCDVLEAAKENVQPLATGRRATALSAILSTPHAQRESKLAATRNRLRINVELALEDEEDDPLEAYCRLVNWTRRIPLLELLEEATRIKYLKLWLLYASFVEKPTIIYSFLIANEIGTAFAILYEELAAVMERDGRRKEADDAYLLGIARRASPLEHLKARHADFQKRMMCAAALPAAPAPAVDTKRTALATTSAASTSSLSAPRAPASHIRGSGVGIRRRRGERISDVGTRKTRVKENVPEAKKMAGSTLRQPGKTRRTAPGAAATSSFVPYVDQKLMPCRLHLFPRQESTRRRAAHTFKESDTAIRGRRTGTGVPSTPKFVPFQDEADAPAMSTPAPESVMKVKKADMSESSPTSEAEALRRDPLKNYAEATQV